jgi:hypothetical protein
VTDARSVVKLTDAAHTDPELTNCIVQYAYCPVAGCGGISPPQALRSASSHSISVCPVVPPVFPASGVHGG